jgi:hypothetical protein
VHVEFRRQPDALVTHGQDEVRLILLKEGCPCARPDMRTSQRS